MKKRILSILVVLMCTCNVQAQFWEGLLYGLIYGLSNASASYTYSNNYNNSSSYSNSSSSSIEKEYKVEDDGFTWYKLSKEVNGKSKYGIANSSGTTLISTKYDMVYWDTDDKYFRVKNNGYDGAVSKSGTVIIEPNKYKCIIYIGGTFKYENSSGDFVALNIDNKGNKINKSDYAESSSSSSSSKKKSSSSSDNYVDCTSCGGFGRNIFTGIECPFCGGTGKQKGITFDIFNTSGNTGTYDGGGGYVPVNTYSGGYENNNTNTRTNNNNTEKENKALKNALEYYERYGDIDCPLCKGSGTCSTCGGRGWYYSSFGSGTITCPNCCYGNVGKCGKCCGTGKVHGKKY
ncbi:MAG: hypothetical protein IIW58_07270 [Bacteroidales bacterium]|nr:hypothetical protein [Bacteroidales bacterium]